jgi:hypothetical protein
MLIHYCRACDTEFRPEIERCSDCGGPLEPQFETPESHEVAGSESHRIDEETKLPPGTYRALTQSSDAQTLDAYAARLGQARIPFVVVVSRGEGFVLSLRVRAQDWPGAAALIGDGLSILSDSPDGPTETTWADCPACGTGLAAGSAECPECALPLGDAEAEEVSPGPSCRYCGYALQGTERQCTYCGRTSPFV